MPGLVYQPDFVSGPQKKQIISYLESLHPIWESRYSSHSPPPDGQIHRQLLRPVYWLGNWQFACLNYYHPPKGIYNRCVRAEAFPEPMAEMVQKIEQITREQILAKDIPREWKLNTCLVNYYGCHLEGDKKVDVARVGEHKDFEPGPVASISFGERALFQFVSSAHKQAQSQVVIQQWLDDSSLQIFGGDKFKKHLFHRVQRVDKKSGKIFNTNTSDYETRRINLTFRYVPEDHIIKYQKLPAELKEDVRGYMQKLAERSEFFKSELLEF